MGVEVSVRTSRKGWVMQKTIAALFGAALLIVVALPANAAGVTTETRDVVGQGRASEGACPSREG